jgi:hypothetical protein
MRGYSHHQHLTITQRVGAAPWLSEQQSMVQLTLALFSADPHHLHNKTTFQLSSVLIPQLIASRPHVNAAAGVLGAAYANCVLHRAHHRNEQLLPKLYVDALRQVQHHLQQPKPEIVPLLVAVMLLAAAESIQHKQKDALCHLVGAFSVINLQTAASLQPWFVPSQEPMAHNGMFEGLSLVQDILHSVDYHISMFAWGRSPQFPPLPVTSQMLYPKSIDDLTTGHPALQQWCLHFIAKALGPEWEERIDFPPTLLMQQEYLVTWLKRWLYTYTLLLETPTSSPPPAQLAHFRILKAQSLTMFIATSNVKPPTQVTYDAYASHFEEIIRCAEDVLNLNGRTNVSTARRPLLPFSPTPGIIHPLDFTARKYRHPVSRRRAIHLLRHAGIEGPFHGGFEARVAARLVEIEEDKRPFKSVLDPAEVLLLSQIVDRNRVYLCWMAELPNQDIGKWPRRAMARRVLKFSRRRRLAPVSRDTKVEERKPDADTLARLKLNERDGNAKDDMWEIWDEVIEGEWPEDEKKA